MPLAVSTFCIVSTSFVFIGGIFAHAVSNGFPPEILSARCPTNKT